MVPRRDGSISIETVSVEEEPTGGAIGALNLNLRLDLGTTTGATTTGVGAGAGVIEGKANPPVNAVGRAPVGSAALG